jgi:hypothetical protein
VAADTPVTGRFRPSIGWGVLVQRIKVLRARLSPRLPWKPLRLLRSGRSMVLTAVRSEVVEFVALFIGDLSVPRWAGDRRYSGIFGDCMRYGFSLVRVQLSAWRSG